MLVFLLCLFRTIDEQLCQRVEIRIHRETVNRDVLPSINSSVVLMLHVVSLIA